MYHSVRKIRPTRRSVSGHYPFRGEESIAYESSIERDFIILQEADPNVSRIISQPISIPFSLNRRTYNYTPDFLVLLDNSQIEGLLIEVKPKSEWQNNWRTWLTKWKTANQWAKDRGFQFSIYDEERIRGVKLENIKKLKALRNSFVSEIDKQIILETIKQNEPINLSSLEMCFPENAKQLKQSIFILIAKGFLYADLSYPIGDKTIITIGK